MPKRIVILDPNGVEVKCATESGDMPWVTVAYYAFEDLVELLTRQNPKLGTYTVTVKEME